MNRPLRTASHLIHDLWHALAIHIRSSGGWLWLSGTSELLLYTLSGRALPRHQSLSFEGHGPKDETSTRRDKVQRADSFGAVSGQAFVHARQISRCLDRDKGHAVRRTPIMNS
nr:hypothetical protein CFP56_37124 [Quercus suber]